MFKETLKLAYAFELLALGKKKKKSSKKKNIPTNKKLWNRAKAEAKKKFDVYPSVYCVPTYSEALTKEGWKNYENLLVGEEILSYNKEGDYLEWTPILDLHFFENAETIRLKKQSLDLVCTPEHKWVYFRHGIKPQIDERKIKKIWDIISDIKSGKIKISHAKKEFSSIQHWYEKYKECESLQEIKNLCRSLEGIALVETKEMSLNGKILASAPYKNTSGTITKMSQKYQGSWLETILSMSHEQIEAFFTGAVICDGWCRAKGCFGFSQKDADHADAFELAAFLSGRRVRRRFDQEKNLNVFSALNKRYIPLANTKILENKNMDVWCPETENGTWVMRQNGHVIITGNSNAWAAKWYKGKGGGWRKGNAADDGLIDDCYSDDELKSWYGDTNDVFENDHGELEARGKVYPDSGLGKWFNKESPGGKRKGTGWVDISRKDKDGKHPPCGRPDANKGGKPKCRPAGEAKKMTKKEKESATSQKRQSERTKKRKGKKPIRDNHKKRD